MPNLPVFSEREITNIQSTKKVCGNCEGRGKVIAEIPTRFAIKNYANGYATYLIRCAFCGGSGTIEPNPVSDGKLAAAGGSR
jgi:hypothetical protein